MKRIKRCILIVFFMMATYLSSYAIIGSDMSWTCLGNDSFLIKVSVYNDCNSPAMGNLTINFKCTSTGTTITTLSLTVPIPVDITPNCRTMCTRCQSTSCSFPFGSNKYLYQGIVNLNSAGSCCNITMSMSYGTRNAAITTGAANTPFYNEAKLNRCQSPCDNSPVFTNNPVQLLCVGQIFSYNHGVQDTDADSTSGLTDSLTYEWAYPMSAANTNIAYTGQYDYNKAIDFYGFPNDALPFPRGIHLDPITGDIQFQTMKAEVTVMVVRVNEFRNGVKIAEVRRDLQIMVLSCTSNNPPSITTPNNTRSKNACSGTPVSVTFSSNDPNSGDTVTISWNNAIPGATWTHNNGTTKHPTATFTWTPSDSQAGSLPYTFTVTAKDNACPVIGQYTQSYQIYVGRSPTATISVSDSGCGNHYFKTILPSNSVTPATWWYGDSFAFLPNTGTIVSHQFKPGHYHFSVTIKSYGCTRNYHDSTDIDTFVTVSLPADTTVCKNATIALHSTVSHGSVPYSLSWGSGDSIFPGDTLLVKLITVNRDTNIWVRAKYKNFDCPWDQIHIKVRTDRKIMLSNDTFFCNFNYAISPQFYPKKSAFGSFRWFKNGSSMPVDSDVYLNVHDTGLFTCVATDTFGCPYTDSIRVHANPAVIASAPDTTVCSGTNVSIMADSLSSHYYSYQWWLNNSKLSSSKLLNVSPLNTTHYSLIANELINGISCSDTSTVTVFAKPLPVFTFDKFDKSCVSGKSIHLDSFVKVNGWRVSNGTWTCPDDPSQVAANTFFSQSAYANTNPGFKLVYSYTNNNTGCNNSDTVYLLVYPNPAKPQIIVTGDTTFCNGYSVSLSSALTSIHFGWSTGDTLKQITITTSGKYKLAVTNIYGCVSDSSTTVTVVVNPKPPTPVISLSTSDSFLECNMVNGLYEWYYRPDTLSSPTTISNGNIRINPKIYCQNCYFNILFTDTNGCISNSSAFYYFHNNAIDKYNRLSGLKFYPNPAHSMLFVEFSGNQSANLLLTDILGNTILETKIIPGKNEINFQNCKPGICFLFLDGTIAGKVMIE